MGPNPFLWPHVLGMYSPGGPQNRPQIGLPEALPEAYMSHMGPGRPLESLESLTQEPQKLLRSLPGPGPGLGLPEAYLRPIWAIWGLGGPWNPWRA